MHKFSITLEKGENPLTDLPVLGTSVKDMFIFDPFISECGRFEVDPVTTYGISHADAKALRELNELIEEAAEAAINAGCRKIQEALCIETGDVAGVFFSSPAAVAPILGQFVDYVLAEQGLNSAA